MKTGYITVNPGVLPLVFETGVLTGVGNNWQTVTLQNTYTSMVVVCSSDLGSTGLPAVCRVRFASGSSFDVMVRNPGGAALSGYTYTFNSVPNAFTAIMSAAAMDDSNGGWPVLYGSNPLTPTSLTLVFDEDRLKDTERRHGTEQVAYIVFGQ